jgi:hypothetical protein
MPTPQVAGLLDLDRPVRRCARLAWVRRRTGRSGRPGRPRALTVRLGSGALAFVLAWSAQVPGSSAAADPAARSPPSEQEVKAAFLYHFAQLVTWPEPADASTGPVVVAVVGRDPFGARLEATIGAERVRGRPIRIERVARPEDLATPPHIAYIGVERAAEADRLLAGFRGAPVLTVGAAAGFAERGGMVEFRITRDSRVAFDINLRAAERAGLKLSSQLLKIARVLPEGPP